MTKQEAPKPKFTPCKTQTHTHLTHTKHGVVKIEKQYSHPDNMKGHKK